MSLPHTTSPSASRKDTARGGNLRDKIKDQTGEARVRVTLWNTGDDAFMPDL
jgi:hypothetical protein